MQHTPRRPQSRSVRRVDRPSWAAVLATRTIASSPRGSWRPALATLGLVILVAASARTGAAAVPMPASPVVLVASPAPSPSPRPSPSPKPSPTPGASPSPGPSASPKPSPTPGASPSPGPSASPKPSPSPAFPAGLVAGPLPGSLITSGAVSSTHPWSGSRPTGSGTWRIVSLPAPWTGGTRSTVTLDVYLPPGYAGTTRRYPVIYEAPQGIGTWQDGMQLTSVMDALITGGQIPPMILVFARSSGGPFADSECANSVDGREWFDRFMSSNLVRWADDHLRTIATSAARATLGFSQGGYCAAALVANHPGIFSTALSFSGYFVAGIHTGTTPDAWRPFNDLPAVEYRVSPMTVVPRVSASLRSRLFFVLASNPDAGLYGPQIKQFAAVLHGAGVSMAIFPTPLGHSFEAARTLLPAMLELVAGRMVGLGVYGPGH